MSSRVQSAFERNTGGVPEDSWWRKLKNFDHYFINQYGDIFNMQTLRLQSKQINNKKVVVVRLWRHGTRRQKSVAKLLRETFGEQDGQHDLPTMQEQVQGERSGSSGSDYESGFAARNAWDYRSSSRLPDGRKKVMEEKIIPMLIIPKDDVWGPTFYMCGRCAHAVKLADVEFHAKEEHQADGVKLYSSAGEANNAG